MCGVDVTQLPGYQQVPPNCPLWKKAMIEKKNKQLEEDAVVWVTAVEKLHYLLTYLFYFTFYWPPFVKKVVLPMLSDYYSRPM